MLLLIALLFVELILGLLMPVFSLPSDGSELLKMERCSLKHDGLARQYFLYLPNSYDGKKDYPLVLLFHGGGGDAKRMVNFTGFDRVAAAEGLIIVCPSGVERHWDDGRTGTGYRAHEEKVDDLGFVSSLIDRVSKDYKIDKTRVYAAGISNGAMMSYLLALALPERICAIGAVVGALPEPLSKREWKGRPVPAIVINGTRDPLVPFEGGDVRFLGKKKGRVISVPDTVSFFARHNRCNDSQTTDLALKTNKSGMKVKKTVYSNCCDGAALEFYEIEGGGHTWPRDSRLSQYLPAAVIGKACKDLDATELIWDFFKKQRLKNAGADTE